MHIMFVSELMTRNPVTVRQDDTLRTAIAAMTEIGCHHLPVMSDDGHLVGVVSDRDCRSTLHSPFFLREHTQDERLLDQVLIRAIMTPAPIVVEPDTPAPDAARLMLTHYIGCLPVMRGETLVGIITTSDILIAFVNAYRLQAETMP